MVMMTMMDTWQVMSGYLTPATLFLLLNLVIATIVLSSRRSSGDTSAAGALFRTTSPAINRLKSFTLHRFRSGEIPAYPNSPNYTHNSPNCASSPLSAQSEPDLTVRSSDTSLDEAFTAVRSSDRSFDDVFTAVRSSDGSLDDAFTAIRSSDKSLDDAFTAIRSSEATVPVQSPSLTRTASILDRIRSINPYQFHSTKPRQHERRQSEPSSSSRLGDLDADVVKSEKIKKKKSKKTASSSSMDGTEVAVRRRKEVVKEEDLDARADDFISKFKENLKIQRLNSIMNYNEMLNRGR